MEGGQKGGILTDNNIAKGELFSSLNWRVDCECKNNNEILVFHRYLPTNIAIMEEPSYITSVTMGLVKRRRKFTPLYT